MLAENAIPSKQQATITINGILLFSDSAISGEKRERPFAKKLQIP
jgi:hypothetical protein